MKNSIDANLYLVDSEIALTWKHVRSELSMEYFQWLEPALVANWS